MASLSPWEREILLISKNRRRLRGERPPGHEQPRSNGENHRDQSGEESRAPGESPGHFENPEAQEPGAQCPDNDAEDRRSEAQDRIFDDEGLDELEPGRAIGLEHDGVIEP